MNDQGDSLQGLRAELERLRRRLEGEEQAHSQARAALAEAEERFRLLTETTGDALYRLSYDSMSYDYISPAIEALTGYSPQEINRLSFASLVKAITAPASDELPREQLIERRRRGETGEYRADYLIVTKDGCERWLADHSYPWLDQQGRVLGSVGILTDITERKTMEERLRRMAVTDDLTGAHNRRYYMELTGKEVLRCRRYGLPLSLLVLDIDHFKAVNDSYGHAVGDLVLKELVAVCRAHLRITDVFGRIGGEEFAVSLVESDLERAARVAERLRGLVEGMRLEIPRAAVRVTISLGVAPLAPGEELPSLLHRADQALYVAKGRGRNRVEMAEGGPAEAGDPGLT